MKVRNVTAGLCWSPGRSDSREKQLSVEQPGPTRLPDVAVRQPGRNTPGNGVERRGERLSVNAPHTRNYTIMWRKGFFLCEEKAFRSGQPALSDVTLAVVLNGHLKSFRSLPWRCVAPWSSALLSDPDTASDPRSGRAGSLRQDGSRPSGSASVREGPASA